MSKLNEIYSSILKFCGLVADSDGFISVLNDDKKELVTINGARLVLPMEQHLRNFNPNEKMIFHPLTENILRGESDVIKQLKLRLNIRLNFVTGVVMQSLLDLVASPALHEKLNPAQAELLMAVKNADSKSVTNFIQQMVQGIRTRPEALFVTIYIKRGGTVYDKRYSRVGIVNFPFYRELVEEKKEVVSKIRTTIDLPAWKQLFQFVFPAIDQDEEYNFGSNTNIAPNLEALLRSAANVASRLNDVISLYSEFIDQADQLYFHADWLEHFDNLEALQVEIRKVPVQAGNDGELIVQEQQPAVPQMVPVVNAGYNPQVQQMSQQPIPARPELKQTKRGIDFQSLKATNMALAMTPSPIATPMQPMMMQAQPTPSWANPQGMNMAMGMQPMVPNWANPQGQMGMQMQQQAMNQGQLMTIQTPQGMMQIQVVQTPQGLAQVLPNGQLQLLPPNMQAPQTQMWR